jgi:hypothetical protein
MEENNRGNLHGTVDALALREAQLLRLRQCLDKDFSNETPEKDCLDLRSSGDTLGHAARLLHSLFVLLIKCGAASSDAQRLIDLWCMEECAMDNVDESHPLASDGFARIHRAHTDLIDIGHSLRASAGILRLAALSPELGRCGICFNALGVIDSCLNWKSTCAVASGRAVYATLELLQHSTPRAARLRAPFVALPIQPRKMETRKIQSVSNTEFRHVDDSDYVRSIKTRMNCLFLSDYIRRILGSICSSRQRPADTRHPLRVMQETPVPGSSACGLWHSRSSTSLEEDTTDSEACIETV